MTVHGKATVLTTTADTVLVTTGSAVRTLTLNRPFRLNAVSEELYQELAAQLLAADDDPTVRCVVLRGAGRAFCAGADLKAHGSGERAPTEQRRYAALAQQVCALIQRISIPVVAAVHGYALGAGAELAVSADFLIVAEDAVLGFPEVTIGTFVGGGVTHRLPRLVGLRRATDLLLLGERFTGVQGAEWGIARAVPSHELFSTAASLAEQLAGKAPISLSLLKSALHHTGSLDDALGAEGRHLVEIMKTADWAEGVAAFAERRTPTFTGR